MARPDKSVDSKQADYLQGKTGYVSEFEEFLNHYLAEHPDTLKNQRTGWNIFWDHKVDLEDLDKIGRDKVPMRGYDYF